MSEFKVGDKVVLRPETKPYTFLNCVGNKVETQTYLNEKESYIILGISRDGDLYIGKEDTHICYISPHHLKHAKENTNIGTLSVYLELNDLLKDIDIVELRLSIFNGDTSRTLEEMQAIENWLLGEK